MADGTRSALAAGGFFLAALGLGVAIWSSSRTAERSRPKHRRRVRPRAMSF
jgi:hypothetical protein